MFYEKEDIENELLKCPSCTNIYDIPYILPCGEMVCKRCMDRFTEKGHTKRISCQFCKGIHVVPHDGFLIQKRLLNLLNKKPKKVFRGVEFERTEKMLDDIKILISEFYRSIGEVKANFKKYCDDLRDLVERDNKLAIEEHEIHKQKVLNDIDLYERKCFETMQYESHLQKSYSTFLSESNERLDSWFEAMNRADLTKNDIDGILNEALNLRVAVITEMDMLNSLFRDKLLKYQKHDRSSTSPHFGRLFREDKNRELTRTLEKYKDIDEDLEEEKEKETSFITSKEFFSIVLSPFSHVGFTFINFVSSELENLNNKFRDNVLKALMSVYSVYIKS
jgi:hypothetical protein